MAEPTTPTPAAPAADASKFAGKFDGPEALETGVRELHTKLVGADLPKALVGKDGAFTTHIALEGYYKTLEAMQGKMAAKPAAPAAPVPGTAPAAPLKVEAPAADDEDVTGILTKAGLKGEDLAAEWTKAGKLTTEQYDKLKATGFPKAAVDVFMRGQLATAKLNQSEQTAIKAMADQITGGDAQTQQLLKDAAAFVPPAELEQINGLLRNQATARLVLRDLMERRAAHTNTDGSKPLINGTAPALAGAGGFTDRKEWDSARARIRDGSATDGDRQRFLATRDGGPA